MDFQSRMPFPDGNLGFAHEEGNHQINFVIDEKAPKTSKLTCNIDLDLKLAYVHKGFQAFFLTL